MTGPQGIGEPIFVQTVVNDSIELDTIATPTTNNVEDYNIADEHRCCPFARKRWTTRRGCFSYEIYWSIIPILCLNVYLLCL